MKISIITVSQKKLGGACLVAGIFESDETPLTSLADAHVLLNKESKAYLTKIFQRGDPLGKSGTANLLHDVPGLAFERLLLVGLGKEKEFGDKAYRRACVSAMQKLGETAASEALFLLPELPVKGRSLAWRVRQAALSIQEAHYRFLPFKTKKEPACPHLQEIRLGVSGETDKKALALANDALLEALAIGQGITLAKDLANSPSNLCTPSFMATTAKSLAKEYSLDYQVLDQEEMQKLGMNSLLSVAKGSCEAPKLIVLHYRGQKDKKHKNFKPVVLIGKGVTFDSGGISLKPGADMDHMKFDMSGAATVLGTINAVAKMNLPINLSVILPCVENMPGGTASKPGDIVTSLSGKTIEILNTDAEGRLILCDALTYAEGFKPAIVIDVATLTGACVIALGRVASGLFANDQTLSDELVSASEVSGDRLWPLPIWEDYQDLLNSPFADMANIGDRSAGSISAACFLARFAEKFTWAHLDIAGTAYDSGKGKCSTGRPIPLLTHYLLHRAGKLN